MHVGPRGVDFLHEHESPLRALQELRGTLRCNQQAFPAWLAEMRAGLLALDEKVAAEARGVDVKVVIDQEKNEGEKSEIDRLVAGHVPTFTDGRHHTAHNKVMIIDHRLIFTGSFTLSPGANGPKLNFALPATNASS